MRKEMKKAVVILLAMLVCSCSNVKNRESEDLKAAELYKVEGMLHSEKECAVVKNVFKYAKSARLECVLLDEYDPTLFTFEFENDIRKVGLVPLCYCVSDETRLLISKSKLKRSEFIKRWLYNECVDETRYRKDPLNISYKEFDSLMVNREDSRKWVYDFLKHNVGKYYYLGIDYEEFERFVLE